MAVQQCYIKDQIRDDETGAPTLRGVFRISSSLPCGKKQEEEKEAFVEEAELERLLRRANLIYDENEEENATVTTDNKYDADNIGVQIPSSFAYVNDVLPWDDNDDHDCSSLVLESCNEGQKILLLGWNAQICENPKGKIMLTTMNFDYRNY